jgi:hypothetical protein
MKVVRQVFATAMAVFALLTTLMVAGGATASATTEAACPSKSHNVNGEGYGYVGPGTHSLRKGPALGCEATKNLADGTKVWFWCAVENDSNHYWWWVRVDGKETYGWIYDGNMNLVVYSDENRDGVIDVRAC